jgi:hypothetical protein
MNTIVTVCRESKEFNIDQVRHLNSAIKQHTEVEYRIVCLNDRFPKATIEDNILFIPFMYDFKARWSKMEMFRKDMLNRLPFLYLDLDTAIIGDIYLNHIKLNLRTCLNILKRTIKK